MIVWQGFGFFAVLIPILTYVAVVKLCQLALTAAYTNTHSWPGALGILLGAAGVWWLAKVLDHPKRMLMDEGDGRPVMVQRKHTLFFVPLLYVAVILAIAALAMLAFRNASPL
jgi:hypothetical protein